MAVMNFKSLKSIHNWLQEKGFTHHLHDTYTDGELYATIIWWNKNNRDDCGLEIDEIANYNARNEVPWPRFKQTSAKG